MEEVRNKEGKKKWKKDVRKKRSREGEKNKYWRREKGKRKLRN